MRPITGAEAQLASWLQRLVAVLLGAGGAVARRLVATVAGRGALLVLDEAQLHVAAVGSDAADLVVRVTAAEADGPPGLPPQAMRCARSSTVAACWMRP